MADSTITGLPTASALTGVEVLPLTQSGVTSKVTVENLSNYKGATHLENIVIVKQASDLSGTLSSTVQYFIDGVIDMGSQNIEVPAGGLSFAGYSFDLSKLTSGAVGYSMFTSPIGGSGNLLGLDFAIEVTGSGSQVFALTDVSGFSAVEFIRVNYNNCTSLGYLDTYRQGLESGTGRFGGAPTLELRGTWVGGYAITTSIVRSLSASMNAPLYKAGAGFVMNSRFKSDQNIDLGATASFFDFSPSNFVAASSVQLEGCIVSRNNVFNSSDTTLIPNMSAGDTVARFKSNVGIPNTFEGGRQTVTAEISTTINTIDVYETLNGTWTATGLQHFDSPSNGQLRHLGSTPREYQIISDMIIDGPSNDVLEVAVRKWSQADTSFSLVARQTRQVNNLAGGRDVAFFTLVNTIILDKDDYIYFQIRNRTSTGAVNAEEDCFFLLEER